METLFLGLFTFVAVILIYLAFQVHIVLGFFFILVSIGFWFLIFGVIKFLITGEIKRERK